MIPRELQILQIKIINVKFLWEDCLANLYIFHTFAKKNRPLNVKVSHFSYAILKIKSLII